LRVYGKDPYNKNARSELVRRAERALVDMKDVKEVRFSGVNITREGMAAIKNQDPPQPEMKESGEFEFDTKLMLNSKNLNDNQSDDEEDIVIQSHDKEEKARSQIVGIDSSHSTLITSLAQDHNGPSLALKTHESEEIEMFPDSLLIDQKIE